MRSQGGCRSGAVWKGRDKHLPSIMDVYASMVRVVIVSSRWNPSLILFTYSNRFRRAASSNLRSFGFIAMLVMHLKKS